MARSAVQKATEAADQLDTWLRSRRSTSRDEAGGADEGRPEEDGAAEPDDGQGAASTPAGEVPSASAAGTLEDRNCHPESTSASSPHAADNASVPLRLPHTDWLHHSLVVSGPAGDVVALRAAAAGAGIIPWQLDLDRLEEDWFHLLVSPPPPQRRSLSLPGARVLAGQLRESVARRHELAVARVGRSRACPLDLHALVPVPEDVLRLGPDHPDALAWLWAHWGTTQALRHVAEQVAPALQQLAPGDAALHLAFWSADWTPWRALATTAGRWPALRVDIRPNYDEP